MSTFHVDSEVGRLRQVILHRPGLELSRLTPRNVDELLFDDILWAKRAREEHDAFAQVLRDHGVVSTTSATCWPRRSTCPEARVRCSTGSSPRPPSARPWSSPCGRCATSWTADPRRAT